MTLAFWSRLVHFYSDISKSLSETGTTRTRGARTPVALERLEDRTVPSTGFNLLGPPNNPTVNFNVPTTGLRVAPEPGQAVGNTPFPTSGFSALGPENGSLGILVGSAAVNSLGLADASVRLFASSAVNSLGIFNQVIPTFIPDVYGFGSGTQPGMPWAPAAYNLGLANLQTSYPSMADQGFQATPPWARNLTHKQLNHNAPAAEAPDTMTLEVLGASRGEETSESEPRYRMITPEQVLDEGDSPDAAGEQSRKTNKDRDEPSSDTAIGAVRNLPSPLLRSGRMQSLDQLQEPILPSSGQGARIPTQDKTTLWRAVPVQERSDDLGAGVRHDPSAEIGTNTDGQAGLININGENSIPDLESVSLTEFPTLSRMFLVPSLATLLMEFPLPILGLGSRAEPLDDSRTPLPLAVDPNNPLPEE